MQKAFNEERSGSAGGMNGGEGGGGGGSGDPSFRELQQRIIAYVMALPGNNKCCDCNGSNGQYTVESKCIEFYYDDAYYLGCV